MCRLHSSPNDITYKQLYGFLSRIIETYIWLILSWNNYPLMFPRVLVNVFEGWPPRWRSRHFLDQQPMDHIFSVCFLIHEDPIESIFLSTNHDTYKELVADQLVRISFPPNPSSTEMSHHEPAGTLIAPPGKIFVIFLHKYVGPNLFKCCRSLRNLVPNHSFRQTWHRNAYPPFY